MRKSSASFFFVLLMVLQYMVFPLSGRAQQAISPEQRPPIDTVLVENRGHAPTRAAMLSAVLPGMGQIYNGRWWKVPIIYAGFGAVVYFVNFNNDQYQFWRNAYIAKEDGNPNTIDPYPNIPARNIERGMNFYRRNLEISYIAGGALYLLNILDASVDAHLLDFDVGEELTMRMQPDVIPMQVLGHRSTSVPGLKLTLRF